jgi:hypothetical protein
MPIKIEPRTMEIQTKGSGRLSPDLAKLADSFAWEVDVEKKKLKLNGYGAKDSPDRLRVWGCNARSRSGWIGLNHILKKKLGLDPEELRGSVYEVKVDGKRLEIQF